MLRPRAIWACFMLLVGVSASHGQAPDPPTRTFLAVPVAVQAPGLHTFLKAYHDGERLYVDIVQLLELIGYAVVVLGDTLSAVDAERRFLLDYRARTARLDDDLPVPLMGELQYSGDVGLITVRGLKQVLGGDVTWDESRLTLRLSTAAKRFETAALAPRRFLGGEVPGPLLFGLDRRFIGGGVVSWHATGQWQELRRLYTAATATYTVSMLGGAVRGTISSTGRTDNLFYTVALPASTLLTRVEIGTQVVHGTTRTQGVRISNLPLVSPHVQRTGAVDGHVEPHAIVEVLAGGQVTDRGQADAMGRYRLRVPVYYGTTEAVVRVRPLGGLAPYERREYILTTAVQAPHRRFYYDVGAGTEDAVAHLRYGVTPRVTVHGGGGGRGGLSAGPDRQPGIHPCGLRRRWLAAAAGCLFGPAVAAWTPRACNLYI